MVGLLERAKDSRQQCNSLLVELKLLKSLVDPSEEANRDVYKSSDHGEDEGADDGNHHEGGGGGGAGWGS